MYQAVKYRQRYSWTHRDLLRKAHPKAPSPAFNDFFAWITKGTLPPLDVPELRPYPCLRAGQDGRPQGPSGAHQGTRHDLGDDALRAAGQAGSMGSPG